MAIYRVQGPDGAIHKFEGPDDATPDQVTAAAEAQFGARTPSAQPAPPALQTQSVSMKAEPLSWIEKQLSKITIPTEVNQRLDKVRGLVMGAADPSVGAIQLGANAVGLGDKVNPAIAKKEAEYERTRALRGSEGFDAYRTAGNLLSPVNAIPAGYLARASSVGQLARRGAAVGAAMGAAQPVTGDNFASTKAVQTGAGALGGALLTPAVSWVAGGLANAVNRIVQNARRLPMAQATQQADQVLASLNATAPQSGFDLSQIPQPILASVRTRIAEALASGRRIDPGELIRRADFEAVGVNPTAGQLSRDPTQFATERNLRGINTGQGGNALAERFAQQGNRLRAIFEPANAAEESQVAGGRLSNLLRSRDEPRSEAISRAYSAARDSSGRGANVDVPAFSAAANNALDSQMLGSYLPAETRGLLNDISSGRLPLNVNNLVQVDRVLSAAQRSAGSNRSAAQAIGVVRDALNAAPIEGSAGQETKAAFDAARGMARERFQTIERVPALRAALDNEDPDKFVSRYLIGAPTRDVRALSALTRRDPDARDAMRSQVSEFLRAKAFGTDVSGDAPFSPERYNKALQAMGYDKLRAFFSPEEVNRLFTAGRVMSYIKTQPEGSAVNNSNTGAAVMNLLGDLTGRVGSLPGANIVRDSIRNFQNERGINAALNPRQAAAPMAPLPPQAQTLMELLRTGAATTAGAVAGRHTKE